MSRLEVKLDSFLRRSRDGKRLRANWLPGVRTVASTVPFEKSTSLARKIFAQWTEQVAEAKKAVEPDDGRIAAVNGPAKKPSGEPETVDGRIEVLESGAKSDEPVNNN